MMFPYCHSEYASESLSCRRAREYFVADLVSPAHRASLAARQRLRSVGGAPANPVTSASWAIIGGPLAGWICDLAKRTPRAWAISIPLVAEIRTLVSSTSETGISASP